VVLPDAEAISHRANRKWLKKIRDSKLVTQEMREELAPLIMSWAKHWCVAQASVEEIDELNIYHASHLAMVRAIEGLSIQPAHVLVDGNVAPKNLAIPSTPIVKGDMKCLSIACASILAKVHRDREMAQMDSQYPGYGFAAHKGYGTPEHQSALKTLGATAIHRRSFAPVALALGLLVPGTASEAENEGARVTDEGLFDSGLTSSRID
jgi:ribonuclease HII